MTESPTFGGPRGGCWPTPTQKLLLRAALCPGQDAVRAWKEWQVLTDIEHLDEGSSRLLPLLWRNLEAQGVSAVHLKRYKSVGRYTWVQNQILLAQAARLTQQLKDEGIPTLLLKGAALVPLYYKEASTRPMDDFDLLVPRSQAVRAFQFLLAQGYEWNEWKKPPRLVTGRSISVFTDSVFRQPGRIRFDVHQHVFSQSPTLDASESWEAAIPVEIAGVATQALCAEDALLHVCVHGVRWNDVPPLRWVADATLILRGTPEFDWNRLLSQSHRHELSIPMRQALRFLRDLDLGLNIPAATLRELGRIPTSRAARREWSAMSYSPASYSIAFKIWLRVRAYSRWNTSNPRWNRPFTFLRYLQFFWGLDSPLQLPRYGLNQWRFHLKD